MPSARPISGPTQERLSLLGDRTRLEILVVLAQSHRRNPTTPDVDTPTLRRRVGVADPGNFSFHLQKLDGLFVRQTDAGYRLTPLGMAVVGTIVAGLGAESSLDPTTLDCDCPVCERPVRLSSAAGIVRIGCTDDHAIEHATPPNLRRDRSPAAVASTTTRLLLQETEAARCGLCPHCAGQCSGAIETTDQRVQFATSCADCGFHATDDPRVVLSRHPAVIGLADRSNRTLTGLGLVQWTLSALACPITRPDDGRYTVEFETTVDSVAITLDEDARVLAVDAPPAGTESA